MAAAGEAGREQDINACIALYSTVQVNQYIYHSYIHEAVLAPPLPTIMAGVAGRGGRMLT